LHGEAGVLNVPLHTHGHLGPPAPSTHFLDGDPRSLEDSEEVAVRLRALLQAVSPAIVYVPVFLDRHPDHRASNAVLQRAVLGTSLDFECRAYEVWTPLVPNRLVRIDDVLEIKLQALACHASQIAHTDFPHMIRGLNAYRASAVPDGAARFAEAFLALPLPEYLGLYRRFSSRELPHRVQHSGSRTM